MFKPCLKRLVTVAILHAILFFALSCLGVSVLYAENFDPTKPPNLKSNVVPAVRPLNLNPQDFRVTSILLSEQRKVAVINNQVVTIGEAVNTRESGKAIVTEIKASEVTLSKARREFVVRLPSSQYTKSPISGPTEGFKDKP